MNIVAFLIGFSAVDLSASPVYTNVSETLNAVVSGVYSSEMDVNDDGKLSIIDSVIQLKEYYNNYTFTFGESDVMGIISNTFDYDNYSEYFYYEIDFVNNVSCRKYELIVSKETTAHIYCELNDSVYQFDVLINPFKGVSVIN